MAVASNAGRSIAANELLLEPTELQGTSEMELIIGTSGPDNIFGGFFGGDVVVGLGGRDRFQLDWRGDATPSIVYGGDRAGNDTAVDTVVSAFAGSALRDPLFVDLQAGYGVNLNTGSLIGQFFGIENFEAGNGFHLIAGSDADNMLTGDQGFMGGGDVILGRGGDDTFYYRSTFGAELSIFFGGTDTADAGNDTIWIDIPGGHVEVNLAGYAQDLKTGAPLAIFTGIENINGADAVDTLLGDHRANRIQGNGGDDILFGGGGADQFVFTEPYDPRNPTSYDGGDMILDFNASEGDRIDVSAIDPVGADNAFTFSTVRHNGRQGELVATFPANGAEILLYVDGDDIADLAIYVATPTALGASAFLL